MVAAIDKLYGIGKNGDLLTNIPENKKIFKEVKQCLF